jgi:hypothetical protein
MEMGTRKDRKRQEDLWWRIRIWLWARATRSMFVLTRFLTAKDSTRLSSSCVQGSMPRNWGVMD